MIDVRALRQESGRNLFDELTAMDVAQDEEAVMLGVVASLLRGAHRALVRHGGELVTKAFCVRTVHRRRRERPIGFAVTHGS